MLFFLKPISEINNTIFTSILKSQSKNIVIVGGGAAGVEVALALKERFNKSNINKNIILISKNLYLNEKLSSNVSMALKNELIKKKYKHNF